MFKEKINEKDWNKWWNEYIKHIDYYSEPNLREIVADLKTIRDGMWKEKIA